MHLNCAHCGTTNRVPNERLADQPVCGQCGQALMAPEPVALSQDRFEAFIRHTELPVVVDFWAEWCGPCRMMAPQFERAAAAMPEVRFAKVDTEAAGQLSAALGIRSIPTLVLFQGGREVARISGALSAPDLQRWISSQIRPT